MVARLEQAAVALPGAALPTPQQIRQFCKNLADKRGEWTALVKGIYMAFELAGTRAVHVAGNPDADPPVNPQTLVISQMLSPNAPTLPAIVDTNPLYRYSGVYFSDGNLGHSEADAYYAYSVQTRFRACGLYHLVLSVGVTTVLHDHWRYTCLV